MCSAMTARLTARRSVALQEDRTRTARSNEVPGVAEVAALEAQAAATDARVEGVAQPLELGDLGVEAGTPAAAQPCPVGLAGGAIAGQGGQRRLDLLQREPDPLCR